MTDELKGWDWLNEHLLEVSRYEGVRPAERVDFESLSEEIRSQLELILSAMERSELVAFEYDQSERIAVPVILGVSSEGNPLMRGFQTEGESKSGRGPGWRVYQVSKMGPVGWGFDYFKPEDFEFDRNYPWLYKVFYML